MKKSLYDTLGVKKTDSKDKIKRAYRKKSLKFHPDQGGDSKEFQLITLAYKILADEEKRGRYDNGESLDDINQLSHQKKSLIMIIDMFASMILNNNPDYSDIVKLMRDNLKQGINSIDILIRNEEGKKKKFESAFKRIKSRNPNNLLQEAAQSQIELITNNIISAEKSKEDWIEALNLLEDFSYEIDNKPEMSNPFH